MPKTKPSGISRGSQSIRVQGQWLTWWMRILGRSWPKRRGHSLARSRLSMTRFSGSRNAKPFSAENSNFMIMNLKRIYLAQVTKLDQGLRILISETTRRSVQRVIREHCLCREGISASPNPVTNASLPPPNTTLLKPKTQLTALIYTGDTKSSRTPKES
jgi:hypothetical protein